MSESDCCKIKACIEFTGASATEEFKEQMKAIFQEIFDDLCGDNGNGDDNGDGEESVVEEVPPVTP